MATPEARLKPARRMPVMMPVKEQEEELKGRVVDFDGSNESSPGTIRTYNDEGVQSPDHRDERKGV